MHHVWSKIKPKLTGKSDSWPTIALPSVCLLSLVFSHLYFSPFPFSTPPLPPPSSAVDGVSRTEGCTHNWFVDCSVNSGCGTYTLSYRRQLCSFFTVLLTRGSNPRPWHLNAFLVYTIFGIFAWGPIQHCSRLPGFELQITTGDALQTM